MVLLGLGAGLIIAPATASVMGSLPRDRAGVGAAINGTALQVGGALGVAVIGSVLAARYQGMMVHTLAGHVVPPVARHAILGSVGGALAVARVAGGALGAALAAAAGHAFVEGMDLALLVGAVVVSTSAVLVVLALPARPRTGNRDNGGRERTLASLREDQTEIEGHGLRRKKSGGSESH
jgi:predicted MFS family arabinose efflux permease